MAHYKLTSTAGVCLGTYEGMTLSDALDARAREAGYDSNAHAIESAGPFEGIAECIAECIAEWTPITRAVSAPVTPRVWSVESHLGTLPHAPRPTSGRLIRATPIVTKRTYVGDCGLCGEHDCPPGWGCCVACANRAEANQL